MRGSARESRVIEMVLAAIALAAVVGVVLVARVVQQSAVGQSAPPAETLNPDIEALRKVDPALVRWREASRFETGFQVARGLALGPEGRVTVAGDRSLRVFSAAGVRQAEIALEAEPTCLALGRDGSLYVGLRNHVEVYTREGQRRTRWPSPGPRAYLTSLAASANGLWAADAGDRVVLLYSPAGRVVREVGKRDPERRVPGLVVPSPHLDVAVAPGGVLWASNPGRHTLDAYRGDGSLLRSWGAPGIALERFIGCCNPTDFAMLPGGGFVTSEKGIPRVKEYDAVGRFVGVVAGPEAFAQKAAGIDLAAGKDGRVWVLDPAARAVRVFERIGASNAPLKRGALNAPLKRGALNAPLKRGVSNAPVRAEQRHEG